MGAASSQRCSELLRISGVSHFSNEPRQLRWLPLDTFSFANRDIGRANLHPIKRQIANALFAAKSLGFFFTRNMGFSKFKADFNHSCIANNRCGQFGFVNSPTRINLDFVDKLLVDENPDAVLPNCRAMPTQNECMRNFSEGCAPVRPNFRHAGRRALRNSQNFIGWQQNHCCVPDGWCPTDSGLTSCPKGTFRQFAPIFSVAETLDQNSLIVGRSDVSIEVKGL